MTVGKVLPFGARGSRNYAPPCSTLMLMAWWQEWHPYSKMDCHQQYWKDHLLGHGL